MVALLTTFTNPFPSSSSITFLLHPLIPPTTVRFSLSSVSTFHAHEWFSILKFSKASRNELKPLLPQLGLRSTKQISIQCSCINSPTNVHTDIGILFPFFRELGLDEKETELVFDKNPALALTSLDSIRARVHSLQSLKINNLALSYLIMKCPSLLTAEEIDPFICYVRDELEAKIELTQLKRVLTATDPRFLLGFDQKVKLLLHHGVPREKIVYVLNHVKLTKALCLRAVEEIDRTITFLSQYGGIDLIVRRPELLNYNLESQLIPRIGFLLELSGGDKDATGNVLRRLPAILSYSVAHVEGHVEFLRSFAGLNDQEIFKILLVFPSMVSASKERKLRPRIEFLRQCGLDSNDIFKFLIKAPLFLGLSFDNLEYKLVFLVKIGYKYRTRDMAMAMGSLTRTSCENLRKVIELFLSYGLSCDDIVAMSTKHPQILQYNHSSLEEKMEYLIEDMGRDIGELLAFPAFLGYKLDERIKARYEAKKKITGEGMSLNKLLTVSTLRFSTKKKEKKLLHMVDNLNCNEG
ncbi:transcription termination factor MTERF8, chloroplastic [Fagus crenata]